MDEQIVAILDALKNAGIGSAILKKDGGVVHTTLPMDDATAQAVVGMGNVAATLLQRTKDDSKELELITGSELIVLIPVQSHYLYGLLQNREQKKTFREYADKLAALL